MSMTEEEVSNSVESSGDCTVTDECLQELLDVFAGGTYKAKSTDRRYEIIQKRCLHFFGRDYKLEVIDNKQGQLCAHYPSEIIITKEHLSSELSIHPKAINDIKELKETMSSSKLARCRSRFVLPVILFENKNICRSATLSTTVELYGRSGVEWILTGGGEQATGSTLARVRSSSAPVQSLNEPANSETEWALLSKVRGQDVQLMKALNVSLICDLMVEKKKLKYGVYVSSSEKVDKWARYSDFQIASMPYPGGIGAGCEFFKEYRNNGYNPVSLYFDWKQSHIDAELCVPEILKSAIAEPCISYQNWDLVLITQNYFKMLLRHLLECEGGLLIHCISGWDRTPLFISLLRLSLWADGGLHQSLCAPEVLYLTLAYDWLMCGHQLKERHEKGEEVLYFCFDVLKHITTEEFSIHGKNRSQKSHMTRAQNGRAAHDSLQESSTGTHLLSPLAFENSLSADELFSSSSDSHPLSDNSVGHVAPAANGHSHMGSSDHTESTSSTTRASLRDMKLRAQRLNEVRELFIKAYRAAIPSSSNSSPASHPLAGITGFLSRLAGSVLNQGTSV